MLNSNLLKINQKIDYTRILKILFKNKAAITEKATKVKQTALANIE